MTSRDEASSGAEPGPGARSVRVLYIAGENRSGSTLVSRVLGALRGASSHSEIHGVWEQGFHADNLCSCGARFRECAFWARVAERAFGGFDQVDGAALTRMGRRIWRSRHLRQQWGLYRSRRFRRDLEVYRRMMRRLYLGIAQVAGSDLVVDSSKMPGVALALDGISGLDVRVLHLVRDVRGCLYSQQKKKADPGFGEMVGHGPLGGAFFWALRQVQCEALALRMPYARIRYEDVARRPRPVLAEAVTELGIEPDFGDSFVDDSTVHLPPVHGVLGNPQRFETGPVEIVLDEAWRDRLPRVQRAVATAVTLPLLARYGYL